MVYSAVASTEAPVGICAGQSTSNWSRTVYGLCQARDGGDHPLVRAFLRAVEVAAGRQGGITLSPSKPSRSLSQALISSVASTIARPRTSQRRNSVCCCRGNRRRQAAVSGKATTGRGICPVPATAGIHFAGRTKLPDQAGCTPRCPGTEPAPASQPRYAAAGTGSSERRVEGSDAAAPVSPARLRRQLGRAGDQRRPAHRQARSARRRLRPVWLRHALYSAKPVACREISIVRRG